MDYFDAVKSRYTHKELFLSDPVPRRHLDMIAHAGLAAPSGGNAQSVSLIVVDDKEVLTRLCAIAATDGLRSAPAAIAVMSDPSTQSAGSNFMVEDYSAATENMLLAATALGYGAVWLDYLLMDRSVQLAYLKVLGAPESYLLPIIIPIGKPDGEGSRRVKKPFGERMSYNRFG